MVSQVRPAEPATTLRLFVAIELPQDVKQALGTTIETLRSALHSEALRWVRPGGIHLTLQFLGAVPAARVPEITRVLEAAVGGVAPFGLAVGALGSFGRRQRMRVIWLGLSGDEPAVADLAARVHRALEPIGFPGDREPFRPHLTLARVRDDASREERASVYDLLRDQAVPALPSFSIEHVSLMQSTLSRGGAVYETLARFSLMQTSDARMSSADTKPTTDDRRPTTED
jgi:RNA 2',3'-cyclic 3'-phosphodiesterase